MADSNLSSSDRNQLSGALQSIVYLDFAALKTKLGEIFESDLSQAENVSQRDLLLSSAVKTAVGSSNQEGADSVFDPELLAKLSGAARVLIRKQKSVYAAELFEYFSEDPMFEAQSAEEIKSVLEKVVQENLFGGNRSQIGGNNRTSNIQAPRSASGFLPQAESPFDGNQSSASSVNPPIPFSPVNESPNSMRMIKNNNGSNSDQPTSMAMVPVDLESDHQSHRFDQDQSIKSESINLASFLSTDNDPIVIEPLSHSQTHFQNGMGQNTSIIGSASAMDSMRPQRRSVHANNQYANQSIMMINPSQSMPTPMDYLNAMSGLAHQPQQNTAIRNSGYGDMDMNSQQQCESSSAITMMDDNNSASASRAHNTSTNHNQSLLMHQNTFDGNWSCMKCGKCYIHKQTLQRHQVTCVHQVLPHRCARCGKGYLTSYQLTRHIMHNRLHTAFACAEPGKPIQEVSDPDLVNGNPAALARQEKNRLDLLALSTKKNKETIKKTLGKNFHPRWEPKKRLELLSSSKRK